MSVKVEDGWLVQRDDTSGDEEIAVEARRVYGLSRVEDGHGRKRCRANVQGDEGGFLLESDVATVRSLLVQERKRTRELDGK